MLRPLLSLFAAALPAAAAVMATPADDVSVRRHEAVRALSHRASEGDAKALYDLSGLHERGFDTIHVDTVRALALLRASAHAGYAPAMNLLGYRYGKGEWVRADADSAMMWLGRAAEAGDARAAANLGYLLSHGDVAPADPAAARRWLHKAAGKGLPQAQSLLAEMLADGRGASADESPDTVRAASLYESAAASGLRDAEIRLVNMMGRRWQRLPVDSMMSLADRYSRKGLKMAAAELFGNAAGHGNAEAQLLLGDAYARGEGVAYDHALSMRFYLKSALQGNPRARAEIAGLLEMFPDLFADPALHAVLEDHYGAGSIPADISVSSRWR